MYTIAKNVQLKIDIMNYLDKQNDFTSTQNIAENLQNATLSRSTLNKFCNELKITIDSLYSQDELQLTVNSRHGLKLERNNTTFQPLFEQLFMSEPFYIILKELFLKRRLNTASFCVAYQMSESKLRRRVKTLNQLLNRYRLHITVSKNIMIKGDESQFRYFYFEFLFFIHHGLSSIPWIDRPLYYLNRSRYVTQYFDYPNYGDKLDVFALWFYINDHSNENISLSEVKKELIPNFRLEKPDCLDHWNRDNWDFFLSFLYSSNIFQVPLKLMEEELLLEELTTTIDLWIDSIEKHFQQSSVSLRKTATELLQKKVVKENLFPSIPLSSTSSDDHFLEEIRLNYPRYYKIFSQFQDEVLSMDDENKLRLSVKDSFLICIELISIESVLPSVNVYFNSSHSGLKNNFNMKVIQTHFSNRVHFVWIEAFSDSDLLISTSNNVNLNVDCNIETVVVNTEVNKNDLSSIERRVNKLLAERYAV